MMKVKDIRWLDEEAKEAELIITDGTFECLAFCHPCELEIGDVLSSPLESFNEINVLVVAQGEPMIERDRDSFAQIVTGKVNNLTDAIVLVGGLKICISNLPGDVKQGEFVKFTSERIDIF